MDVDHQKEEEYKKIIMARYTPTKTKITRKFGDIGEILKDTSAYATYKESSRTPSVAELGCADPDQPCRLPNSFQADPPLDQVKNRSFEIGARGFTKAYKLFDIDHNIKWDATAFAGRNYNDIIFIGGNRVGTGYFRNVGNTQRMGTELGFSGKLGGNWTWYSNYSYVRASYETHQKIASAGHSGLICDFLVAFNSSSVASIVLRRWVTRSWIDFCF